MTKLLRRQALTAAFAVAILMIATSVGAQTFTLNVPFRPGPVPQTARVKIVFESAAVGVASATVDGAVTACPGAPPCNTLGNFGPGNADLAQLKTTATTAELTLTFISDFGPANNFCVSSRVADRPVSITLANVNATGYRMASYTVPELTNTVPPGPPAPRCDAAFRRISAQKASLSPALGVTNLGRLPLDVILVLDKSGSMGWSLPGGPAGVDRWERLQDAVGQFMGLYSQAAVALSDGSTVEGSAADRIGLILFDSAITNANLEAGSIFKARGAALTGWDDATDGNIITAQLVPPPPAFSPGGNTSIGGGITRADLCHRFTDCLAAAAPSPQDPIIIVFTDGEQNTPPCILSAGEADVFPCTTTRIPPLRLGPSTLANLSIPILTIGLGNVGASAELLDQIAHETAGHSTIAATGMALDVAFADTLVKALKGNTLSLMGRLSEAAPSTGSGTPLTTLVDNSVRRVTWVLGWEGVRSPRALSLEIRNPAGTVIKPVRTHSGPAYFVASADIPASGTTGDWTARVVRGPVVEFSAQQSIQYHLSAYAVENRLDYRFSVLSGEIGTDEPVTIRAEMAYDNLPLSSLQSGGLRVSVARPGENLGTIMHNTDAAGKPQNEPGAPQSAAGAEYDALAQSSDVVDRTEPSPLATTLNMQDRGNGVYEATFSQTVVGGKYRFRVDVEWDDPRTGRVRRTEFIERQVPVLPTPAATQVQLNWDPGSSTAQVLVTPRDRFGNFVGPGFGSTFVVQVAPPATVGAITNPGVNGTYTIPITGIPPGSDPNIRINYGRSTLRDSPLSQVSQAGGAGAGWSIGLRAGISKPEGALANTVDSGFAFDVDLERRFTSMFAAQAVFGFNSFGDAGFGDLNVTHLSGNLKAYFPAGAARVFVNGGAGLYWLDPGDTEAGSNFGFGVQFDVAPKISVEGAYNFHVVATDGTATKFSTYQGGVRIRF